MKCMQPARPACTAVAYTVLFCRRAATAGRLPRLVGDENRKAQFIQRVLIELHLGVENLVDHRFIS
jgi:hypothetical protein